MLKHVSSAKKLTAQKMTLLLFCLLMPVSLLTFLPHAAYAAGMVGSGNPSSCDEAALLATIAGGGLVTFNCGPNPHTITTTAQIDVDGVDLIIDGDGLITIAAPSSRAFEVINAGSLELRNLTVSDSSIAGSGGAVRVTGSTLTVISSTLKNNTANRGGAIYSTGGSTVAITNSAILSNTAATSDGGGLRVSNGTATIVNSTFAFNNANLDGGAIALASGTGTELAGTTIVDNSTTSGSGAGIQQDSGAVLSVRNVIVARNNTPGDANCNILDNGNFTIAGSNFANDASCTNGVDSFTNDADVVTFLGPLADNGGSTQTFALLDNNPAIDAVAIGQCLDVGGGALATDQRLIVRPQGTSNQCDSGAFELVQLPTVSLSSEGSVLEGTGGLTSASFTATLSAVHTDPVSVTYTTTPGTATADVDYTGVTDLVVIPAGALSNTFTVDITTDSRGEFDETFTVTLTAPVSNAIIAGAPADAAGMTIIDDDVPQLSIGDGSLTEGDTGAANMSFEATLDNPSDKTITVTYQTANGTAINGLDYTAVSDVITFTPGSVSETIAIPILGDTLDEFDETFTVTLTAPLTNATIAAGQGTGTILDDDDLPALLIDDLLVSEGDGVVTFTANLTAASGKIVTANYDTADGTATGGSDYLTTSGTITFTPGEIAQTIEVTILDDALDEDTENFFVNLSGETNATLAITRGTGTITDNDAPPEVSVNSGTTAGEGDGTATFTATLSAVSGKDVTVSYTTTDGTALAGSDYTATSDVVTINAGQSSQTFNILISDDAAIEMAETFTVTLTAPVTNATIGTLDSGIGTILDNDAPGVVVAPTTMTVSEPGGSDVFTITLNSAPTGPVTVTLTAGNSECSVGATEVVLAAANWNTGVGVTVNAVDDDVADGSQSCLIQTGNTASEDLNYQNLPVDDVTVTVDDDDTPGVSVTPTTVNVSEIGTTDTFAVALDSQPTAAVTISFATDAQLNSLTDLTFTAVNWATPQTVTVSAVDDALSEGTPHTSTIVLSASSSDPNYGAGAGTIKGVTVSIADNDVVGITLSESGGDTAVTEGGPTDTYTLVLTSQPDDNVAIAVTPDNQTDVGAGAGTAITLFFAPANWSTPQTVTVVAVDDALDEGAHSGTIAHTVTSNDPAYNGLLLPNIVAGITDNDGIVYVYLPLALRSYPPVGPPDLVIDSLAASSNAVTVVLRNTGGEPTVGAFWVDVYINPAVTPTLNAPWDTIADEGLVWAVTDAILPGAQLTLTIGDIYYDAIKSTFNTLTPGTPVWAQVDSINHDTTYGNIQESDETNNIAGPVLSTAGLSTIISAPAATNSRSTGTFGDLPPRR